jgi:putative methyltransferase (TIGR04325 family)
MTVGQGFKIWEGVYQSFSEARGDVGVFEQGIWLEKVKERARSALSASRSDEAIPPVAETRDYALPLVAALAARNGETLRILDFGGGLASSFIPLVNMLPADQALEFVIVENEAVCQAGRDLLAADKRVQFVSTLPGAGERFDIVHCGSSLHYVDDWNGLLARLAALNTRYLVFADLPAADNLTLVTAQMFHGARSPVRFWNLNEFSAKVESLGYRLLFKARYRGSFLGEKDGPPTGHFEPSHRLCYFSQRVFQRVTPRKG